MKHLDVSFIVESLDDSSSGNEHAPEATDDEEFLFVSFVNQII